MKTKIAILFGGTGLLFFISFGGVLRGQPARKTTCSDISIRTTLYNSVVDPVTGAVVTSAIYSDGTEYADGASGVSARINLCSGTNDAVVSVSARRSFTGNFSSLIPGSVIQERPSWVPGIIAMSGWINVRNILYSKQPFTTHVGSTFSASGNHGTYHLGFMPYVVDAPDLHTDPSTIPGENTPYDSSNATVYPQAFDCNSGGVTKPSWIVVGNNVTSQGNLEVGTLHKMNNNGTLVHEGQYTLPFELRIEALSCFNY